MRMRMPNEKITYTSKLREDFKNFKKEHRGCGPNEKAVFWQEKAEELADLCDWMSDHLFD